MHYMCCVLFFANQLKTDWDLYSEHIYSDIRWTQSINVTAVEFSARWAINQFRLICEVRNLCNQNINVVIELLVVVDLSRAEITIQNTQRNSVWRFENKFEFVARKIRK